jgi:hypothetical protein
VMIYQIIFKYKLNENLEGKWRIFGISEGFDLKDSEEIEELFCNRDIIGNKESLSFLKLNSGRYCICCFKQCNSKNEDAGVHVLHALVLSKGKFPFYPVMMYKSPVFENKIYEEENQGILKLPTLKNIELGEIIAFESVSAFIRSAHEYNIRQILSAYIDCINHGKGIIISSNEDYIVYLVASIQMAFPENLAHEITFSSSILNNDKFMISTRTSNQNHEICSNNRFDLLDLKGNIINYISSTYKFTHIVEIGYLVSKHNLDGFHKFLNCFRYDKLDYRIEDAYNLYTIIRTGIGEMDVSSVKSALEFSYKNGTDEAYRQILLSVPQIIDKISREVDSDLAYMISNFLFKAARQTNSIFFIDRAYDLFFKSMYNLVFSSQKKELLKCEKFYNRVIEENKDLEEGLAKYLVDTKRINMIVSYLPLDADADKSEFYLRVIISSLIKLKYSWKKALLIDGVRELFDSCINNITNSNINYKAILDIASEDKEYFVNVFMNIYDKVSNSDIIIEVMSSLIKLKDDVWKLKVRRDIKSYSNGDYILFQEFILGLKSSQDIVKYFQHYYESVFKELLDYREKYFEQSLKAYLELIPKKDSFNGANMVLNHIIEENINLNMDILLTIIKEFEEGLALLLPNDDLKNIIGAVKNLKRSKGIVTNPDIIKLIDFGIWIDGLNNSTDSVIDEIIKEEIRLEGLDEKRYNEYINWCLPILITFCIYADDHRVIIRTFNICDKEEEFFLKYMEHLEGLLKEENSKGYEILLSFMIYFFFYFEPRYKLQGEDMVLEKVTNKIINILSGQSKSWVNNFSIDIKNEFGEKGLSIPVQWNEIYNKVMAVRSRSVFDRVIEFFKEGSK